MSKTTEETIYEIVNDERFAWLFDSLNDLKLMWGSHVKAHVDGVVQCMFNLKNAGMQYAPVEQTPVSIEPAVEPASSEAAATTDTKKK